MITFIKKHHLKIVIGLLAGFFIFQTGYFALNVDRGVPPDELEHLMLIDTYAKSPSLFPEISNTASAEVNQRRFFYYMLLGKLGHFNLFGINQTIFLRFINVALSLAYLFVFYKLLELFFEKRKWLIITAFTIQTNILMFNFLSASVNYDNLLNLLAVSSIYFVFKHLKTKSIAPLFMSFICMGLAMITKESFGPLGLGLLVVLIVFHHKNFKKLFADAWTFVRSKTGRDRIISIFFLLIFLINVWHYSHSYIRYGSLFPSCQQMYSLEECVADSPNYATFNVQPPAFEPLDPLAYSKKWYKIMPDRIFGIFAHQKMSVTHSNSLILMALVALFLALFIRTVHFKNFVLNSAMGLAAFYTLFLQFYVNYKAYLFNGIYHAGVQGRYLFPVMALFIIIFTHFLLTPFKGKARAVMSLIVMALFIYTAFPAYWTHPNKGAFERPAPAAEQSPES